VHGYNYTRYADDITFSHDRPIRRFSPFLIDRIRTMIEEYGLKINDRKTCVRVKGEQLEVTGLVVGDKVNVSPDAMSSNCAHCCIYGSSTGTTGRSRFTEMISTKAPKRS